MLSTEELGIICLKVSVGDATFPAKLIEAAGKVADELQPGDLKKLEVWAMAMRGVHDTIMITRAK